MVPTIKKNYKKQQEQILRLYTTWRKCLRQLLKITHVAHGEYLPLIVEGIPIEGQLMKRFIKFYNSVINSDNNILQFCGQLVTNGSNSAVCKSVMYVKSKYNLKYKCDNTLSIKELYTELGKHAESYNENDIIDKCCGSKKSGFLLFLVFFPEILLQVGKI